MSSSVAATSCESLSVLGEAFDQAKNARDVLFAPGGDAYAVWSHPPYVTVNHAIFSSTTSTGSMNHLGTLVRRLIRELRLMGPSVGST